MEQVIEKFTTIIGMLNKKIKDLENRVDELESQVFNFDENMEDFYANLYKNRK